MLDTETGVAHGNARLRRALCATVVSAAVAAGSPVGAAQSQPSAQPIVVSPIGYRIIDGIADTTEPLDAKSIVTPTFTTRTNPSSGSTIDSRVVIGPDDRGQATNTTSFPFRAIGAVDFNGRTNVCTGWLASAQVVVTAGHCVKINGQIVENWTFSPGRNGTSNPFGSAVAEQIWTDTITGTGHDWAVVQLDRPIGDTVGWFGTTRIPPQNNTTATVTGYPTDKPLGTMWSATDTITQVDQGTFAHTVDTYGGQSGSPVSVNAEVNGIHVSGAFRSNMATLITPSLHDVIVNVGSQAPAHDETTFGAN